MSDSNSLVARVARLEAREQIRELLVRYALLIDDHEFDALGNLFTPTHGSAGPARNTPAVTPSWPTTGCGVSSSQSACTCRGGR